MRLPPAAAVLRRALARSNQGLRCLLIDGVLEQAVRGEPIRQMAQDFAQPSKERFRDLVVVLQTGEQRGVDVSWTASPVRTLERPVLCRRGRL